jgi:hypothetical protein
MARRIDRGARVQMTVTRGARLPQEPLDATTVERLCVPIFSVVRDHLAETPPRRERVMEALNALAAVAAVLIVGTGSPAGRRAGKAFLRHAVEQSVAALLLEQRAAVDQDRKRDGAA